MSDGICADVEEEKGEAIAVNAAEASEGMVAEAPAEEEIDEADNGQVEIDNRMNTPGPIAPATPMPQQTATSISSSPAVIQEEDPMEPDSQSDTSRINEAEECKKENLEANSKAIRNKLVDHFLTNELHLDMIAKVEGDYVIDDDGLPKVKFNVEVCWPFTGFKHKGWARNHEKRIMEFSAPESLDEECCKEPSTIHVNTMSILEREDKNSKETLDDCFSVMNTKIDAADKDIATKTFLRSIAMTYYGTILSTSFAEKTSDEKVDDIKSREWVRDEREAVLYFKIGALGYKIPFCKYLYGHALIYGTGGIKKNIVKGIGLLHDAGTELLIAEAFFELGAIYERGVTVNTEQYLAKDYVRALHFYQDSITASKKNQADIQKCVWVPEIGMMKGLLCVDSIHLEEDLVQHEAGLHYSWIILGHSFLFATVASFADSDSPDHYSPLLILLPILGIIIAGHSLFNNYIAWEGIKRNQKNVDKMLDEKFKAYKLIIESIEKKQNKKDNMQHEQDRANEEEKNINARFKNHQKLAVFLILISFILLLIWLLLLLNEILSFWPDL